MKQPFKLNEQLQTDYRVMLESAGGIHFLKWLQASMSAQIESAMNEGDAVNSSHKLQRAKGLKIVLDHLNMMTRKVDNLPKN